MVVPKRFGAMRLASSLEVPVCPRATRRAAREAVGCVAVFALALYVATSGPMALPAGGALVPAVAAARRGAAPEDLVLVMNKMCPFAQRAWLALEESGLHYKIREVNLGADLVYDLNPKGLVPVLVDDAGEVVVESEVIVDVIAGRSNSALREDGVDADRVARCRDILNNRVLPAGKKAKMLGQRGGLAPVLHELDEAIVGPYMVGDRLSPADISAAPMMQRLFESGMVPEEHARLVGWWRSVSQRPAFLKTKLRKGAYWWWW
mmetsp:Transcript_118030/g.333853  ORF Transcript_118030/g.333853 Transcript_118030/m.333853 type:complete len:263 (-) Transcript_118030:103-891(-)